ncbi:Panacea domain-containing protein [Candidatus Phytoplasma pruni]|uniref:DUF4065 domain-containing protein n=1 Tax=Candidatus Phytoplasma pruni TaxID=479893 RepID=A0A851HBX0_9MOLU|nr:type II toxin-antitoxin system antitoxin SocA domain-containing protein [Candidatus Phytoplasma pruni]NWN45521.1 DUF4065 domain-containing protein [Candidatus Phytoplasma pruni]
MTNNNPTHHAPAEKTTTNIFDLANYIITVSYQQKHEINHTKLQNLLYYAQAYHLIQNNHQPLFEEPIEAWPNCPLIPDLYFEIRKYPLQKLPLLPQATNNPLSKEQQKTLDFIINQFKHKTPKELNRQVCQEDPWEDRFGNYDISLNRITNQDLIDYFTPRFPRYFY